MLVQALVFSYAIKHRTSFFNYHRKYFSTVYFCLRIRDNKYRRDNSVQSVLYSPWNFIWSTDIQNACVLVYWPQLTGVQFGWRSWQCRYSSIKPDSKGFNCASCQQLFPVQKEFISTFTFYSQIISKKFLRRTKFFSIKLPNYFPNYQTYQWEPTRRWPQTRLVATSSYRFRINLWQLLKWHLNWLLSPFNFCLCVF